MEEHQKNGLAVGRFLESHYAVEKVRHPGLPSHPQHELAKRQMSGHSGMISFYLKGKLEESGKFLKALKVFTLAESLGGFESLAELPYSMTHASVEEKERIALGVAEDLIADLKQALEAAVPK